MGLAVNDSSCTALQRKQLSNCNMGLALHKVDTEQRPEGEDIASHSHAYMAQYTALCIRNFTTIAVTVKMRPLVTNELTLSDYDRMPNSNVCNCSH